MEIRNHPVEDVRLDKATENISERSIDYFVFLLPILGVVDLRSDFGCTDYSASTPSSVKCHQIHCRAQSERLERAVVALADS
jgi:hypothetical protein